MAKDSKQIAQEVMEKTNCAYERAFPDERVINKLDQMLECTKPISCIRGKEADGGTVDFVDVPDNQAQLKALDMVLDIRGLRAAKKLDATIRGDVSLIAQEIKKPRNSGKKPQDVVSKGANRK